MTVQEAQQAQPVQVEQAPVQRINPRDLRISQRAARGHSARVDLFRTLLPVSAVAIVSAFVFTAQTQTIDYTFANRFENLDKPIDDLRMDSPHFVGDDKEGGYEIVASSAKQNILKPSEIALVSPKGVKGRNTSKQFRVTADKGLFKTEDNVVDLNKNVELTRGIGGNSFVLYTESARVGLEDRTIKSQSEVYGVGAAGELHADEVVAYDDGRSVFFNTQMRINTKKQRDEKAAQIEAEEAARKLRSPTPRG